MHFSIKKGLDLPLSGKPIQTIEAARPVTSVAILGNEYHDMKPTMLIEEGQSIKLGQALFTDKKILVSHIHHPGHVLSRPSNGVVKGVIIELYGDDEVTFERYDPTELNQLKTEQITQNPLSSCLWTAIRTRTYSKSPNPGSTPHSIFVTAIDTKPLAADPNVIINEHTADYTLGLTILRKLTEGKVSVCQSIEATEQDATGINIESHALMKLQKKNIRISSPWPLT